MDRSFTPSHVELRREGSVVLLHPYDVGKCTVVALCVAVMTFPLVIAAALVCAPAFVEIAAIAFFFTCCPSLAATRHRVARPSVPRRPAPVIPFDAARASSVALALRRGRRGGGRGDHGS